MEVLSAWGKFQDSKFVRVRLLRIRVGDCLFQGRKKKYCADASQGPQTARLACYLFQLGHGLFEIENTHIKGSMGWLGGGRYDGSGLSPELGLPSLRMSPRRWTGYHPQTPGWHCGPLYVFVLPRRPDRNPTKLRAHITQGSRKSQLLIDRWLQISKPPVTKKLSPWWCLEKGFSTPAHPTTGIRGRPTA